jgi:hypothetical protein
MSRTQNNKATNAHIGMLKARLAKLRTELLAPASGPGGGGEVHRHQYDSAWYANLQVGHWLVLCVSNDSSRMELSLLHYVYTQASAICCADCVSTGL